MNTQELTSTAMAMVAGDKGHPAAGFRDLERRAGARVDGSKGALSSCQLQPGCTARRIQRRDGKHRSMTNSAFYGLSMG